MTTPEPLYRQYRVTTRATGMVPYNQYRRTLLGALRLAYREAGREIQTCGTSWTVVAGQSAEAGYGQFHWVEVATVSATRDITVHPVDTQISSIETSIQHLQDRHNAILAHQHAIKRFINQGTQS